MAVEGMAPPAAAARSRPQWLETLTGQALALLAAFGIAIVAGSVLILAYGESPVEVYSSILEASVGSPDGIGYVLAIATPLIFSALAISVCFKGGLFNIGVEGQYLVAMVDGASNQPGAEEFIAALTGSTGRRLLAEAGFDTP